MKKISYAMMLLVISIRVCYAEPTMFEGAKFGVGLAVIADLDTTRVQDARLDRNGIVRVERSNSYMPRLLLDSHTFWEYNKNLGIGPFCAVTLGGDGNNILGGVGGGIMAGMRTNDADRSFNIGIGAFLDPYVKTLGQGIRENKPLPDGESEIRYQYKSEIGLLILFSYAW